MQNNSKLRESLDILKCTNRKKSLEDSGVQENKVHKLHMGKNIDAGSCFQKLILQKQSQRSLSLRNVKSLLRRKASEQKVCNRINENIDNNRSGLQKSRKLENTYSVINIDSVLEMHGLYRLKFFAYTAGDCLFNTLQVLLHFSYTVTKIRKGIIGYFRACLKKQVLHHIFALV